MGELVPIRLIPDVGKRRPIRNIYDIHREIDETPKPVIKADRTIRLGACGMGMPLLKSHWTLQEMKPGEILRTESSHPCSYPDIHAYARRNKNVELVGEEMEDHTMIFYLRKR
jgi:TusA-related sulfurtransferase